LIHPPLSIDGSPSSVAVDDEALREVAFAVRADMSIRKVTVEVTLQGSDDDLELANRAVERATQIAQRLAALGVEPTKIERVGGVSTGPPNILLTISERAGTRIK
jgi:hypothetical protein